ncbi:DNA repair protein rhp26 [Coemansia asiatica]|nr:DNA repair protein rhp26 [Coemansia asiatica]
MSNRNITTKDNSHNGDGATAELQKLSGLGVHVVDQRAVEQSVQTQAACKMAEKELEAEQKRYLRLEISMEKKREQLGKIHDSLARAKSTTTLRYQNASERAESLELEIDQLGSDMDEISTRIDNIKKRILELGADTGTNNESIKSVSITSAGNSAFGFNSEMAFETSSAIGSLASLIVPRRRAAIAAEQRRHKELEQTNEKDADSDESDSYSHLSEIAEPASSRNSNSLIRTGKRKRPLMAKDGFSTANEEEEEHEEEEESYHENSDNRDSSGGESAPEFATDDEEESTGARNVAARDTRKQQQEKDLNDDGNESMYQIRIFDWSVTRWRDRHEAQADSADLASAAQSPDSYVDIDGQLIPKAELIEEPFLDDPQSPDYKIKAHDTSKPPLRVPHQIWENLLEYQKASLRWMFTLHQQNAGGILGDEMGLGKTVQVAAFLASMYHSRLLSLPSIIVCPATLMRQWVREIHTWWPALRVVILHSTGYAMRTAASTGESYNDGGDALDLLSGQRLSADLTSSLPSHSEAAIWEAAKTANPHFGGSAGGSGSGNGGGGGTLDLAKSAVLEYNSDDDYEYDAYGSRIRRKRRPRGYVDWRKQQKRKSKMRIRNAGMTRASQESLKRAQALLEHVFRHGHIVIVTYSGLQVYRDIILPYQWGYAVLDEGHMIRNPDAEATQACKRLDTRHRILVTGTPIQNNLTELWSLFDFIFPGRLGTLPVFNNQFTIPITVGGYASANSLQVRAGYRCACILRDLIDPYLLRRLKCDVASDLPQKTEQVLFCRLTPMQRSAYKMFLRSSDMERILLGKLQMLFGVDVARKICDHPDLLLLSTLGSARNTHSLASGIHAEATIAASAPAEFSSIDSEDERGASDFALGRDNQLPADYGNWKKSGKLTVVRALLQLWKPEGHRVLIFCQTRQMLDILERMVSSMPDTNYRRMDGMTPVQHRTSLVDEYNRDKDIFVFLLTTRVGGLGVNLTGADRVILYSPDWNPSSDAQARERAWRLGQTRDVAIYRLMTAGTIEEKIYNRQIYKQFLSNKVLADPNQKRFFQSQSLQDLFSLAGFNDGQHDDDDDGDDDGGDVNDGDKGQNGQGSIGRHASSGIIAKRSTDAAKHAGLINSTSTARMFAQAQLFPSSSSSSNNIDATNKDPVRVGGDNINADSSSASAPLNTKSRDLIESIDNLVRMEQYKQAEESEQGESSSQRGAADSESNARSAIQDRQANLPTGKGKAKGDGEDHVLQALFKMSGVVHSALKHDAIINSGRGDKDADMVEQEASRIAHEARLALRESQRFRRQMDVRVPTWTGASGQAGMPSANKTATVTGQRSGAGLVAPPPRAIVGSKLPAKIQEQQRQERLFAHIPVGKPRRDSPASQSNENLIYSAGSLSRRAVIDRALPSSNVVASLSTGNAHSSPFGSHAIAGLHQIGTGQGAGFNSASGASLSSASVLARLKAQSADIGSAASAAAPTSSSVQIQSSQIGRVSDFSPGSRSSAVGRSSALTGSRAHGMRPRPLSRSAAQPKTSATTRSINLGTTDLASSGSASERRQHKDAHMVNGLSESDRALVEKIRSVLIGNGGEMSNRALIDSLRPEVSALNLARLKVLAQRVAYLGSRQPSSDSDNIASRVGIGRIVQKVWKLKDK